MTTRKLAVAAAILLCTLSAGGQERQQARSQESEFRPLSQVKRIFVPTMPRPGTEKSDYWNDPNSTYFQERLTAYLVKGKRVRPDHPGGEKWAFTGDCSKGYETYVPGVIFVCNYADADAMLLGSVSDISKEATTDERRTNLLFAGVAYLYDTRTNAMLWETSKTSWLKGWEKPEVRYDEPMDRVASRIVDQFEKDIRKAQKLAESSGNQGKR
jgi:hypothetical protein